MGVLIPWPTDKVKVPIPHTVTSPAEYVFNLWREARIKQGWEEFKWHNLSETQKFVWKLVAAQLWKQEGDKNGDA